MIIQEPVQAAIWHCLNHYNYKDATFLAERLCSEVETDETIFILATCYFRSNDIYQAYWLLKTKSPRSPQCRYLLAKCAYQLKKLVEAEAAISSINFNEIKNFEEIGKEFGEIACFVLQLIANICLQTERKRIAIEANKMALKLNPFLWHSFADLCNMGEKVDPNSIFQFSSADIFNTCQGNTNTNSMILFGNNGANSVIMLDAYLTSAVGINNNLPLNNTSTTISSGDIINNTSSNNYILSTPGDNNLQTPVNPPNVRTFGGGIGNVNNISIGPMHSIDDTPFSSSPMDTNITDNCTPFRKQFKYLSMRTPGTPSFGILPISPVDTPLSGSNYFGGNNLSFNLTTPINNSNNNINNMNNVNNNNNTQSPQTLVEMNQEQKSVGKKLKGHVGNILIRKDTPLHNSKPTVFTQTGNITPRTPNSNSSQNVRRSSRLFSNNNYSVKENSSKSPNINSKFVQPRSPPRKTKTRLTKISLNNELINEKESTVTNIKKDKNSTQVNEKVETITSAAEMDSKVLLNNTLNSAQTMAHHVLSLKKQSAEGLMALLRDIGQSYLHLSQFNCTEAISNFSEISKRHLQSSWIQSQIALAFYEQRKYETAAEVFKRIHEKEPYRLQYMEIYSTVLWHLQKDVALSALAQDLMAVDKRSAITWSVAGNCFSLHKEHETAIKFFKRAVQVEPNFVYSYTLLGHELIITEELEKAMNYFRTAILKDSRHYNAWFGIGTIYSKQERYELAELHYRQALKINPKNSIIIVHIGAMQFFMHKTEQALATLNTAATVDPKNPLCKFHRGSIYYQLGKHQEALKELEELKQIVPKESVVFYLIGKIHKTLGNVDKALMHFSWATDLDPKGANNQLKDAFDSINHNPRNSNESNSGNSNNGGASSSSNTGVANESSVDVISVADALMNIEQELEIEPVSERSDDSTQAQHELDSYDNDSDNY